MTASFIVDEIDLIATTLAAFYDRDITAI